MFIHTILLMLFTTAAWTQTQAQVKRVSCAQVSGVSTTGVDQNQFFEENAITMAAPGIKQKFINQFINEYAKFPQVLRQEMVEAGATVHIIEGAGVANDPSWDTGKGKTTFDGRDFFTLPGSGGMPWVRPRGSRPTRIVTNRLYEGHGSVNMVLHETAHALDSTYHAFGISSSTEWASLITGHAKVTEFILKVCGTYCTENKPESFAELFAQYHACGESRQQMEKFIPEIADYFERLTHIPK